MLNTPCPIAIITIESEAGIPTLTISHKIALEGEKSLRLNVMYACFFTNNMYTKIIKTINWKTYDRQSKLEKIV